MRGRHGVPERAAARSPLALWRRWRGARSAPVVRLDDVRRRLELLLAAMYGASIPIVEAERAPERGWRARLGRLARRSWRARPRSDAMAASDGVRIHLPAHLDAEGGVEMAIARYRLFAVEQAERVTRGTAALVPGDGSPLERDLYLLAEATAADAAIARAAPGLVATLAAERAAALHERPALESLAPVEREVERLIRLQLTGETAMSGSVGVADGGPVEALVWARATAARLSQGGARYRGVPPVPSWGTVRRAHLLPPSQSPSADDDVRTRFRQSIGLPVGASGATEQETEQGGNRQGESGAESEAAGGAGESPASADGAREPTDAARAGDAADDAAGTSAEHREAPPPPRLTAAMDETVEVEATYENATAERDPREREARQPGGIEHPEWDWRASRYAAHGSVLREREAAFGDHAWADAMLVKHAALVRRLRERFERLRSRRTRLPAQRDGDELDLAACVRALVDRRTGAAVDDRLYVAVRPARRGIAILLLVDISGSTDEWVSSAHRVIDVEKMAVLMASEALDALGDLYAVMTFSGRGRDDVRVRTIKAFAERNDESVRGRIAALEPEGFTRLGAAVRHATQRLAHEDAGHRLLLILSDGKPNDEDEYEGRYGVEDSRQAIFEARASGVFPFCLTIDREGREYLTRIFGAAGHTILPDPEQLPLALLAVVRHLLAT